MRTSARWSGIGLAAIVAIGLIGRVAYASSIWYVAPQVDPAEDGSIEHPFSTLAAAIDVASSGDGIADVWEHRYADNLETLGSDLPDEYGLTHLDEYLYGTNPLIPDTSGDGFPDRWLIHVGLDPLLYQYDFDHDGDGYTLREEFVAGTDPLDPNSYFVLGGHLAW